MARTMTISLDDCKIKWDGWVPTLVMEEYHNGKVAKKSRVTFTTPCMIAHLRETLRSVADVMRKDAETI